MRQSAGEILTAEVDHAPGVIMVEIQKRFGLLFANGADVNEICKISGKTLKENYAPEPVAEFLTEV